MGYLPCFLCGNRLEQRTDKNAKPYFVCDPCGIQLFIRRQQGIEKLRALLEDLETHEIFSQMRSPEFSRILAIFNEISAIKSEIKKIDDGVFLFANAEQSAAKKALQKQMNDLLSELQVIGDQEDRTE